MKSQSFRAALPVSVAQFNKTRKEFEKWLIERGSAIKQPTNPYEVVRFTGQHTEAVVYRDKGDSITHWANGSLQAYQAFLSGGPWRAVEKTKRNNKTKNLVLSLAERDGWNCPFCGQDMDVDTASIEHFVSITAGGTSHMSNLSLMHENCNNKLSHLSVRQKIELILKNRIELAMKERE